MQFTDDANSRRPISERIQIDNEIEYDTILEKIGFGKAQWILLIISGLLTICSVATMTSVGIMAIASQCEFGMSQFEKGVMMAASTAGVFLSTYFWGYVCDAKGRRVVMIYSIFVTNILQFISLFVTNIWIFNVINLLLGISLGGVSAAMYAYLSEFNTPKNRAVVINYSTMFVSVTAIYVPATAWLVLSWDWSLQVFEGFVIRPWRLIIILNLLPGLIGALMLMPFPESPKLLLSLSRDDEALDAIDWVCHYNGKGSTAQLLKMNYFKLKPEPNEENILDKQSGCGILVTIWQATKPLFEAPHRRNFLICTLAIFGIFFVSALQLWYPEIVNRSSGRSGTTCEILEDSFAKQAQNATADMSSVCVDTISSQTYVDNIIVGVVFLIGFSIQGAILNPLGRKNVLVTALVISTLCGFLLEFTTNSVINLIFFCLLILLTGTSISIMIGAVVDLLPTHLRGKGASIAMSIGRLGLVLAANIMGLMLEHHCRSMFALFTAILLVCVLLVKVLPI